MYHDAGQRVSLPGSRVAVMTGQGRPGQVMPVRLTSPPVNGLHTGPALFIFCGLMYTSAITLKTVVIQQRCKR
jgi:hypothetical protein